MNTTVNTQASQRSHVPLWKRTVSAAAVNLLILLVLLGLFEAAGFLLPRQTVANLFPYRSGSNSHPRPPNIQQPKPLRGYPREYYSAHPHRGFSIARNTTPQLDWVDGVSYKIWGNRFGCFDSDDEIVEPYIYLTGDSYAWGYTPFKHKFGTVLEQNMGRRVVKAGVSHSGQLHQLDKMNELTEEFGISPKTIVVSFYENDVANDFAYPHSAVMEGYQVDVKHIVKTEDGYEISREDEDILRAKVRRVVETTKKQPPDRLAAFRFRAKKYSLTFTLLDRAKDFLGAASSNSQHQRGIYSRPKIFRRNDRFWYADNPHAENNRTAILQFRKAAEHHGARLLFLLVPPMFEHLNDDYYAQLKNFLHSNDVNFVDLASAFPQDSFPCDFYWPNDGHLNIRGNAFAANILERSLKELSSNHSE